MQYIIPMHTATSKEIATSLTLFAPRNDDIVIYYIPSHLPLLFNHILYGDGSGSPEPVAACL
jgi:hypothetical protein